MADFIRYELDGNTEVIFESAEADLVALRGGQAEVADGGSLQGRLQAVAGAAEVVSDSLRQRLTPDEVTLEFGIKVSGELNWWFFAKNQAEATINVTLKWTSPNATE